MGNERDARASRGNTTEDWKTLNDPNADKGKQAHIGTRGVGNTVVTAMAGVAFIKELPEMAEKMSANNLDAKTTRKLLEDAGVDINEATNGVFLPKNSKYVIDEATSHASVHTKIYYETVRKRLEEVPKEKIRNELQKISQELLNGTFPY